MERTRGAVVREMVVELRARHPLGSPPWVRLPCTLPLAAEVAAGRCLDAAVFQQSAVRVISTVDIAEYPDSTKVGPQWHVSAAITGAERRPSAVEMLRVRRAFGMLEAEEDNHEPGNARHLFLVVDPAHRVACECKATEVLVTEFDGHQWSNAVEPAACRGCEYERNFGKPCPLHREKTP